MYAAFSFTIAFLRSLFEETTIVSHHLERPLCFVINDLSKIVDIMLLLNMSKPYIAMSDSLDSDASSPTRHDRRREESSKAP